MGRETEERDYQRRTPVLMEAPGDCTGQTLNEGVKEIIGRAQHTAKNLRTQTTVNIYYYRPVRVCTPNIEQELRVRLRSFAKGPADWPSTRKLDNIASEGRRESASTTSLWRVSETRCGGGARVCLRGGIDVCFGSCPERTMTGSR